MEDQNCRESDCRAYWFGRNQRILDWLLYERSSIICLQVFVLTLLSLKFTLILNFYAIYLLINLKYISNGRSFGLVTKSS